MSGRQWGTWNGGLVLGVLKGQHLRMLQISADGKRTLAVSVSVTDRGRLRTPAVGPDGALYVTTGNGANIDSILRITPSAAIAGATSAT